MTILPANDTLSKDAEVKKKVISPIFANRWEKKPYEVPVLGKTFIVHPRVFSPRYCADTAFYAEQLPVDEDGSVLEIGCGTGIVSLFCIFRGARLVVATDINPLAIQNTVENAVRHDVLQKISARVGDVYDAVFAEEKFDLIFWNLPFGYIEKEAVAIDEAAVLDPGYKALERFIAGARLHLKKNGRLLFGCCPLLSRFDLITALFGKYAYGIHNLASFEVTQFNEKIAFVLGEAKSG